MNINATLLVEVVIFLAFVYLTMRYVWPPILAVLQERQMHIDQGLKNADQAKQTLDEAHTVADKLTYQARVQADEIVEQAQLQATDLLNQAKLDCEELKRQTEASLIETQEKIKKAAQKQLRSQVSGFCIDICKKILGEGNQQEVENKVLMYFTQNKEPS